VEADVTAAASTIDKVQFYVDGVVKYNVFQSPYTWNWGMALGRHTLKAEVIDLAGNTASKEIDVTIFSILPGRNNAYSEDSTHDMA